MTTMHADLIEIGDRLAVVDALYRFAAGQDRRQPGTFRSAFADDATLDFTQPAGRFGVDVAVMRGRAAIEEILTNLAALDTTHTVTNPQVAFTGDGARLEALVEAQHVTRDHPTRHLLLKNLYDVELVRQGGAWVVQSMIIRNVWWTGDPAVLFGPDAHEHGTNPAVGSQIGA